MSKVQETQAKSPKFVLIGGGTGSFSILSVLKNYIKDITALVNMADDGGSTGVLRDELGVLPPGDVRQCLVALSQSSDKIRDLFNYRFGEGTFAGHSFGNLFLSAVEKMTDNFTEAVELASEVLNIQGHVIPITLDECILELKVKNKPKVVGQFSIENTDFNGFDKPTLSFSGPVNLSKDAKKGIEEADLIIIAPGNLYISLIPSLLVGGVGKTLQNSKAVKVYIANLVNKPLQTKGFGVHDYANELERVIGGPVIDYVLYNTDKPDLKLLEKYALDGEFPVEVNEDNLSMAHYSAIGGKFLSRVHRNKSQNDSLINRSLIRHDGDSVARQLMNIYFSQ